jgi:hypothetical protein
MLDAYAEAGGNVVDTAINYRGGGSQGERAGDLRYCGVSPADLLQMACIASRNSAKSGSGMAPVGPSQAWSDPHRDRSSPLERVER